MPTTSQQPLHAEHDDARRSASTSSTAPIIITAIAEPSGQFWATWNWLSIIAPIMLPDVPPSSVAVTKSPHIGMNVSRTPAAMPGPANGSVTCRNVRTRLAPRSLLASRMW